MKSAPLMVMTVSIAPFVGYRSISLGEDAKHPECTVTVTIKVNSAAGTLCLTSLSIVPLCVYLPDARFFIPLPATIVGRRSNTPARPAHPSHCPLLRAGKLQGGFGTAQKKKRAAPPFHLVLLCKTSKRPAIQPKGTKTFKTLLPADLVSYGLQV